MSLSKKELIKQFNKLNKFNNNQEKIENDAMMLHARVMQIVEIVMDQKGWNKKTLANKLGISPSYLTQLFVGDKMINLTMIAKIQHYLGIKLSIEYCDGSSIKCRIKNNFNENTKDPINKVATKSKYLNLVA
ncbi:MAG: helix-turn-helix transcriptional regulator [Bacteroidota bacterium]|nr:helix-turn-helix transcriptional regulator [Bacteroidota bacterium]